MHIRPPKIHWRKYVERKVVILAVILAVIVVATALYEEVTKSPVPVISTVHHFTLSILAGHLFFGIPFGD